ncbi:hypothetical protein PGB90_007889 [Kerria lacca]
MSKNVLILWILNITILALNVSSLSSSIHPDNIHPNAIVYNTIYDIWTKILETINNTISEVESEINNIWKGLKRTPNKITETADKLNVVLDAAYDFVIFVREKNNSFNEMVGTLSPVVITVISIIIIIVFIFLFCLCCMYKN